ncbi:hypothetical protein MNBD_GAMMA07-558 [hydrothermal vent metagenome]|uniref:Response regulatory domain-containing protein n=1 Tax=hydrothermal vent metagenome TaxID=652676 RepID=A0A3B0WVB1_9ZZZZ
MANKRALVIDDSKSARFVLKRMLVELQLDVDAVESAQDGINYLELNRPDIIFMDHMMPGMDGMEATKRIKENPQTSAIPIMMYTSKGGDLYLSQLKALGIIGIVPKTIGALELQESLLSVGLIDNATLDAASVKDKTVRTEKMPVTADNKEAEVSEEVAMLTISIDDLRQMLDDQTIELHKSMWLGIESVSNEIFNRLNVELEDRLDQIENLAENTDAEQSSNIPLNQPVSRQVNNIQSKWLMFILGILFLISFIFNSILISDNSKLKDKMEQQQVTQPGTNTNRSLGNNELEQGYDSQVNQVEIWDYIQWATKQTIEYPFDELALNDQRMSFVENIINRAVDVRFKGRIILQTHVGKFCLSSDTLGRYKLAKKKTPVTSCELVGNNIQPNDQPAAHQSLAFVNYLEDTALLNESGIIIEVTNLPRNSMLSKYPKQKASTTADKWNKAAQKNNRISVKLDPGYFSM